MNRLHRERVAQDEDEAFGGAQIREFSEFLEHIGLGRVSWAGLGNLFIDQGARLRCWHSTIRSVRSVKAQACSAAGARVVEFIKCETRFLRFI